MDSESWDLEAVVRGGSFSDPATVDPFTSFPPLLQEDQEALPTSFPDLWESSGTALYELEELCRPFILKTLHQPSPPQQQLNFFTSKAAAASPSPCQPQKLRQTQRVQAQSSRSKRRKNQVKKVVCEVPVDGAPPDMWAWRKYGQKPIKGSPHPRGYYRCSSSKGCPARKQVERSRADPSMLVITYTAEHSHPIPTHRSSLAGSTRHKFTPALPSSSSPTHGLSPTTPLSANMDDDELLNQRPSKEEDEEVGYMDLIMDDDDLFGEDLTGMDESKGGYFVESLFSPTWLVDGNAAAAAARSS